MGSAAPGVLPLTGGLVLSTKGPTQWAGQVIELNGGAKVVNTGDFQAYGDWAMTAGAGAAGGEAFTNSGNFTKVTTAGPGGITVFTVPFNNAAPQGSSVTVQVGTLELRAGQQSGAFTVQQGAQLHLAGNMTLNSGTRFDGAGLTKVDGVTVLTIPAGQNAVNGGTFELSGFATIRGSGIGGGAGQFGNVYGVFNWKSGTLKDLLFSNSNGSPSIVNITGSGAKELDSSIFTNMGGVVWDGGDIEFEVTHSNCQIDNIGTFAAKSANKILKPTPVAGNQATFINDVGTTLGQSGQFSKTPGGVTEIEVLFRNYGTVNGAANILFDLFEDKGGTVNQGVGAGGGGGPGGGE